MSDHPTLPFESAEEWRPVVGFPNYAVSDRGRVWSIPRKRVPNGRMLPQSIAPGYGYLRVSLHRERVSHWILVHRLVGEAFLGPLPEGQMTRHGPAGKHDNSLSNLSYGTAAENAADMIRDGNALHGTRNQYAKITEEIVANARRRHAAGERCVDLAAEYGVSPGLMRLAVTGQSWTHVEQPGETRKDVMRGTEHHDAKLTEGKVREIRRRCGAGEKQRDVAADYGVSQMAVWQVVNRKSWKHVA